ncbi:glycosyltransferase [Flavitalea antarctica]
MTIVLSPVYNDWESYDKLLWDIRSEFPGTEPQLRFLAINDCSGDLLKKEFMLAHPDLEIIELTRNLGHQKAIVIGLAHINDKYPGADVIVMDSDGEDKPQHIRKLMTAGKKSQTIVFAKRGQRSEGLVFLWFYRLYKRIFYWLTGSVVDFGNFSFIPADYILKVVSLSEIWNHYSAGILRTKLPFTKIALERGQRYAGHSKMNFYSLIVHGLSAISVYSDVVATRLIVFSIGAVLTCVIGIIATLIWKFFTNFAVPNWATTVIIGLMIIIFQAFFMAVFMAFSVLSNRTQLAFLPSKDYRQYIARVIE